jgi:hypothetical protein
MDELSRKRWIRAVIIAGVAYFVVGFGSARAGSLLISVVMWRRLAWVVSGVIFAAHIGYERFRLVHSAATTAIHAAIAVGLGAFLLALGATVNKVVVASHPPLWRYLLALVLWPILTGVPAFVVAFIAAAILARLARKPLTQ